MLKGFETITIELFTEERQILLPMIVAKLVCHKGKANAIRNIDLIEYCSTRGVGTSEPRVRKVIEHIRQTRLIDGLIASRSGYFIADSPAEILDWIDTMKQRRNALDNSINAAFETYKEITKKPRQNPGTVQSLFN